MVTTGSSSAARGPAPDYTGPDQGWAGRVARGLSEMAGRSAGPPRISEIWVTRDLALHVRYEIGGDRLAVRFAHLDVDPTTGGAPSYSGRLASDLFHNLHTDPGVGAWRDDDGFAWWGDEPRGGWASTPEAPRVLTLAPQPQ